MEQQQDLYKTTKQLFEEIDTIFQATDMPKFKGNLRGAGSSVNNLVELLVRKSLLKANKYNYTDDDDDKFMLPDQKVFQEEDKAWVMYDRLSAYVKAIEYVSHNIPDTLEQFDDELIKDITKLLDYFCFHNFNSSNAGINTRTLKDMTDRIMSSKDDIFKKLVSDNLKLLRDSFHGLQKYVKNIMAYMKEHYKAKVRFEVYPELPAALTKEMFDNHTDDFLNKVEKFVKDNPYDISFKRVWVVEALRECYSFDEAQAIDRLKKMFLSEAEQKKIEAKKDRAKSPREKLITMIFKLVETKKILEQVHGNMDYNLHLIHNRKKSLVEKVQDILRKLLNMPSEDEFMHIEYVDPATKKIKQDVINISEFMKSVKKKLNLFKDISTPNSSLNIKVRNGTKESLVKFLDDTYFNLLLTKERILGMNTEIRINTPRALKGKLRDILDLTESYETVLSNVGSARKKFLITEENFGGRKKSTGSSE